MVLVCSKWFFGSCKSLPTALALQGHLRLRGGSIFQSPKFPLFLPRVSGLLFSVNGPRLPVPAAIGGLGGDRRTPRGGMTWTVTMIAGNFSLDLQTTLQRVLNQGCVVAHRARPCCLPGGMPRSFPLGPIMAPPLKTCSRCGQHEDSLPFGNLGDQLLNALPSTIPPPLCPKTSVTFPHASLIPTVRQLRGTQRRALSSQLFRTALSRFLDPYHSNSKHHCEPSSIPRSQTLAWISPRERRCKHSTPSNS